MQPQYNRRVNTWNQFETNIPWKKTLINIFRSYYLQENINLLSITLHFAKHTNEYVYRWTNQRHLKMFYYYCHKSENITHLSLDFKKVKKLVNSSKSSIRN